MAASRHVVLDPQLIVLPNRGAEGPYLQSLGEWLGLLTSRRDECSFSEATLARLFSEERYPTFADLKRLCADGSFTDYSAVDLANLLRRVSETEPFLEHACGYRDAVATALESEPADLFSARDPTTKWCAEHDLLLVSCAAALDGWCEGALYWATPSCPESELCCRADVALVEDVSGDVRSVNRRVESGLKVLANPDAFACARELTEVYSNIDEGVRIVRALLRQSGALTEETCHPITAESGFVASIERHGIDRQPALLSVVYERLVLAASGRLDEIPGAKVHSVRVDRNADAPQVRRDDGATLWRCMVSKRGAGYRLHYWRLADGGVEASAVMTEGECFH